MPDYTSPGNYTYTMPFAAATATFTVIGGGGSGNKDCDDDDLGGGGGGGGFARSTRNVTAGSVFSIAVGAGGAQPSCEQANGGGQSYITGPVAGGGVVTVSAGGGGGGTDNSGGGSGGFESGDEGGRGQSGNDDDKDGRGGGAGRPGGGDSGRCSGDYNGGQGTNLDGSQGSCSGGKAGGTYGGGGGGRDGDGEAGRGGNGAARITVTYGPPSIQSFTVTSTDSGNDGIPDYDITFAWSTTNANSLSINQGVGTVTGSSKTINSGLQSVAGSNSPITRTYTLTASGPGGTVTATATTSLKNDDTPSGCNSTPSTITDGTAINNLPPGKTDCILAMGAISGVDMITKVQVISPADLQISTSGGGGWGSSILIGNGTSFYLKFTSPAYNTDPTGQKNPKTLTWKIGSGSNCSLTVYTRAPDVNEEFDLGDNTLNFPYPDIDINPAAASQYMQPNYPGGSTNLVVNDVDIPVELKVDKPNTQIRVKKSGSASFGAWDTWT